MQQKSVSSNGLLRTVYSTFGPLSNGTDYVMKNIDKIIIKICLFTQKKTTPHQKPKIKQLRDTANAFIFCSTSVFISQSNVFNLR